MSADETFIYQPSKILFLGVSLLDSIVCLFELFNEVL